MNRGTFTITDPLGRCINIESDLSLAQIVDLIVDQSSTVVGYDDLLTAQDLAIYDSLAATDPVEP